MESVMQTILNNEQKYQADPTLLFNDLVDELKMGDLGTITTTLFATITTNAPSNISTSVNNSKKKAILYTLTSTECNSHCPYCLLYGMKFTNEHFQTAFGIDTLYRQLKFWCDSNNLILNLHHEYLFEYPCDYCPYNICITVSWR
jgi:hypothetical protein